MWQRLTLSLYRWLALRRFPHGIPQTSYFYLDYFVPYGGTHDRVMIYEHSGVCFLCLESTGPLSERDAKLKTTVTLEGVDQFFRWLRDRFPDEDDVLKTRIKRDPAELSMFVFDANHNWKRSICIYDVHLCDELQSIRGELIERINQLAMRANAEESPRNDPF